MTTEATPPVAAPTPPPAAAPPAPAAPQEQQVSLTSKQLQERLAEANGAGHRAALKSLGFEKPEDAATALKKLKELEDANKTEKERLEARIKELEPQAGSAVTLKATLDTLVADQFAALPEAVRNAVDGVAKGDSAKRLEQIKVLRESGLLPATPVAPSTAAAPTVPAAPAAVPPITTAPSPAPPPSGAPTAFQKWQDMEKTSPMAADIFFNAHQREIEKTRPAQA